MDRWQEVCCEDGECVVGGAEVGSDAEVRVEITTSFRAGDSPGDRVLGQLRRMSLQLTQPLLFN